MKSSARALIILCLVILGVALYSCRRKPAPAPAPAVEPAPVQTEQKPPEKIIAPPPEPPPTVSEAANPPISAPVANETPADLKPESPTNQPPVTNAIVNEVPVDPKPEITTNFTASIQAVEVTNPPPFMPVLEMNPHFTNRLTLSLRFGLNISGKFKDVGSSFSSGTPLAAGRRTPNGDPYNYDDGYVLTDSSGNFGGQSWYWGYDHASQVNASGANTIDLHHTVATGLPSQNSGDDSPSVGAELTYDYELGVKEDWHHLRYGFETAANFMPIEFNSGGSFNATLSQRTDTYGYTSGTTPPSAPYQGSFGGPGFVINVPPVSSTTTLIPGATFIAQQHFEANLWGFRLGPYLELPVSKKLDLYFTGGLAAGLLDSEASWKETLVLPGGGGSLTAKGSGSDVSLLWGYYLGLEAAYQFTGRWSVETGVQFQDLGTYDHNFGGRVAELDLSKSIFVHGGISYSF